MAATWKIVAAALLIFAAGVVTGGLTTGAAFRAARTRPWRDAPVAAAATNVPAPAATNAAAFQSRVPTNRAWGTPAVVQRVEAFRRGVASLDLSASQREAIDARTAAAVERIRALWTPVAPRLQQEIRELRQQIAAELTPEQRERFDALVDRKASAGTNGAPSVPRPPADPAPR